MIQEHVRKMDERRDEAKSNSMIAEMENGD